MTITSIFFLIFIAVGTLIYYLFPKKFQWAALLIMSIVFYVLTITPYTFVYIIAATAIAYLSTYFIKKNGINNKKTSAVLAIALILNILIWFVFKGNGLWAPIGNKIYSFTQISWIANVVNAKLIAALGMGYYTLQIMGYIIDCYWGNIEPQKNPLKLLLFVCFFPQLTTGPISKYTELTSLYESHTFSYRNLCLGSQRILWGFFKKLVLSERIAILISAIQTSEEPLGGFYSWIVILIYPIQMYADFSGCMDIVIGVSEILGITLPENFNNPFFARSSQEFWQRWHITLGAWAKDYVLYPVLKSSPMVKFSKWSKKKFGKKTGKFLATSVGMFVLWMVMGIWHGGYRYIVGVSLWYWIILMLGDLLSSSFAKIMDKFGFKSESFSWHFFQSARTYLIYAVGAVFFANGVGEGIALIKDALSVFVKKGAANPWIFYNGSLGELAGSFRDINIMIFGVLLLIIVGILREKFGYARNWVEKQGVVFRWLIWIGLFVLVLIYGKYGPGYDAAAFIYQEF